MLQISKDAEILRILSHHILVTVNQRPRVQALFKRTGSQPPMHSFSSSTSGCTVITPHLGRGPNRPQAFGPTFCVCVCLCVYTHVCVGGWVAQQMCLCVCVWSVRVLFSQCKCDSCHFIMGKIFRIHHCRLCSSVPLCQHVFTLSHIVHGLSWRFGLEVFYTLLGSANYHSVVLHHNVLQTIKENHPSVNYLKIIWS